MEGGWLARHTEKIHRTVLLNLSKMGQMLALGELTDAQDIQDMNGIQSAG